MWPGPSIKKSCKGPQGLWTALIFSVIITWSDQWICWVTCCHIQFWMIMVHEISRTPNFQFDLVRTKISGFEVRIHVSCDGVFTIRPVHDPWCHQSVGWSLHFDQNDQDSLFDFRRWFWTAWHILDCNVWLFSGQKIESVSLTRSWIEG